MYDILITGSCTKEIGSIKSSLHSEFSIIDFGLLRQFLGLKIEKYKVGIKANQPKHAVDLLLKFKMAGCKASNFPFLSGIKLGEFGASPLVDNSLYIQLVGSLLYLTHSRPNLEYVVGVVSIYMYYIDEIHRKAANIILHYVQGTKHFGVHYDVGSPQELVGFTDFD